MSYTPRVATFIGLETRDVLLPEAATVRRTKYNEDTGEPYEVEAQETRYTLFGRELPKTSRWPAACAEDLIISLGTPITAFGETECPGTYIGLPLTEVNVDHSCEHTLDEIHAAFAKAEEEFKKLGYDGPLKLYSLLYYV
jgi:hypothetical protein